MGRRSRTTQFFATPTEMADLLGPAAAELDLVVCAISADAILEVRPDAMAEGSDDRRRLIGRRSTTDVANADWRQPARFGLVVLDLPVVVDLTLLMASLASTNSWVVEGTQHTTNESPALHRRLERALRTLAVHGARVANDKTGATGEYDDIRISEGAATFARSGGYLRQEGVANLRFHPAA